MIYFYIWSFSRFHPTLPAHSLWYLYRSSIYLNWSCFPEFLSLCFLSLGHKRQSVQDLEDRSEAHGYSVLHLKVSKGTRNWCFYGWHLSSAILAGGPARRTSWRSPSFSLSCGSSACSSLTQRLLALSEGHLLQCVWKE